MNLPFSLSALLLSSTLLLAEPVEKRVALHTTVGGKERYITLVPFGGLNVSSTVITDRQVFFMSDLNGGQLADGDLVKLSSAGYEDKRDAFWKEEDGRIGRGAKAAEFKLKKQKKGYSLQAPSGKYLSTEYKSNYIPVTDSLSAAAVFEIQDNPATVSK